MGKWHLGDDTVKQRGFDEWVSVEDHTVSSYYDGELPVIYILLVEKGHTPTGTSTGRKIFDDTVRSYLPEDSQMATFLAEKAEEFIDRNSMNPFLRTLVHLSLILLMAVHLMECTTQIQFQQDQLF